MSKMRISLYADRSEGVPSRDIWSLGALGWGGDTSWTVVVAVIISGGSLFGSFFQILEKCSEVGGLRVVRTGPS